MTCQLVSMRRAKQAVYPGNTRRLVYSRIADLHVHKGTTSSRPWNDVSSLMWSTNTKLLLTARLRILAKNSCLIRCMYIYLQAFIRGRTLQNRCPVVQGFSSTVASNATSHENKLLQNVLSRGPGVEFGILLNSSGHCCNRASVSGFDANRTNRSLTRYDSFRLERLAQRFVRALLPDHFLYACTKS
jgi:hypothetical protein